MSVAERCRAVAATSTSIGNGLGLSLTFGAMNPGVSAIDQHKSDLAEQCRRFGVQRLEIFGSATRGDFNSAQSDFDFVVSFADKTLGTYADRYLDFATALEHLFGRKVDLLTERLLDVVNACEAIAAFTEGNFTAYEGDHEIIGEALNRSVTVEPSLAGKIPDLHRIVGLRHRLIHGYDNVDDEILWHALQTKLESLKSQVESALRGSGGAPE